MKNKISTKDFPPDIEIETQIFENWSQEIDVEGVTVCFPKNEDQIVDVINWANDNGIKIKAKGRSHTWAPLNINPSKDNFEKIIFVDTERYLNNCVINKESQPSEVIAKSGILMDDLLQKLEDSSLGLSSVPAVGDITLGGVIAVSGHGTGIPAKDEEKQEGQTYGSLSNTLLSAKVVVWDQDSYKLKEFIRSDEEFSYVVANLGRLFMTEVKMQVMPNYHMSCHSYTNISIKDLCSDSYKYNINTILDEGGRLEIILYPFTDNPWLKVWSVTEQKPVLARHVTNPYNYIFSDNILDSISEVVEQIMNGLPELAPAFGNLLYSVTKAGIISTLSSNIWGWSKDVQLYVKPTTLLMTQNGYVILTERDNIQHTVDQLQIQYNDLLEKYSSNNKYPINGPMEIRITEIDKLEDVTIQDAKSIQLSPIVQNSEKTNLDCAVWFGVLTLPGTPHRNEFYLELEQWLFETFQGSQYEVRVEWSKGWAYTEEGGWLNQDILENKIPNSFNNNKEQWLDLTKNINNYDPHEVYSTSLLSELMNNEENI